MFLTDQNTTCNSCFRYYEKREKLEKRRFQQQQDAQNKEFEQMDLQSQHCSHQNRHRNDHRPSHFRFLYIPVLITIFYFLQNQIRILFLQRLLIGFL